MAEKKSLKVIRGKLQLSRLEKQIELLTKDVDITELRFITSKFEPMGFHEAIIDGEVNRTIEGASTVKITVNDYHGLIRRSGRLAQAVDIKIDGLWFRLVKVEKSGNNITMTFESREVAILRSYNRKKVYGWGAITRTRFAQTLVEEVKEFDLPFICPELVKKTKKQTKVEKAEQRAASFGGWLEVLQAAKNAGHPITIKGVDAQPNQLRNCEAVLDVGMELWNNHLHPRKLMVCAIMTGIVEQTCHNKREGHETSVGFFQQTANNGWGTEDQRMNLDHSSREFYERADKIDRADDEPPPLSYGELCQNVQRSGHPKRYALYRVEAEQIVTAYGVAGKDARFPDDMANANNMSPSELQAGIDDFQFARGRPKDNKAGGGKGWEKEDSWTCLQRLADEVNWRCFEVSGKIYFMSEPYLFAGAARAWINEDSEGVDWIDWDYDIGKAESTITITARVDRWQVPPGAVIAVNKSGPANGRWLITEINRSFFNNTATITAKKPRAVLDEPKQSDQTTIADIATGGYGKYVPTPGWDPTKDASKNPKGKALRNAVLGYEPAQLEFTRDSQRADIVQGKVKPRLLQLMLDFMEAGFKIRCSAMRTDHNRNTTSGGRSAHNVGKAIDMNNFTESNPGQTRTAMLWIGAHPEMTVRGGQLIGPIDELVKPYQGFYDEGTLAQHDNHIHMGIAMTDAERQGTE